MSRSPGQPDTTAGGWVLAIVHSLNSRSLPGEDLARQAGIDPERLAHPEARSSVAANARFWRLAVEVTGDSCFGLRAAAFVPRAAFGALTYAMMASATLKEAFARASRYHRVMTTAGALELRDVGTCYRLIHQRSPEVADEAVDALFSYAFASCQYLHKDRAIVPLAVRLRRPAPPGAEEFHRRFRVTVSFAQPGDEMDLSREVIERPLPAGNAVLARNMDEAVKAYLARIDPRAMLYRIRTAIIAALPSGEPSQATVAAQVGLSVRQLQRQLAAEGTSFLTVLDDAREQLAYSSLAQGEQNVSEVAFLLGFSDVSAFSRAFKRWTGTTPSAYAARHRGIAAADGSSVS